jgi:hypothetical protein
MELLEWVVQHPVKGPPEPHILKACFSVLKDFYDIKDRLSPDEALNDPNFMRKLGRMLWIFYGVGISPRELREGLKGLEEDDG